MVFFGDTALAGVTLLSPKATLHDAGLYFSHPTVKWDKLMEQLWKSVSRPHPLAFFLPLTLAWGHLLQLMNQC